ncbi:MAG: N-acetylgalactosamine-6-sulfatase, partial [Verrucomicrobia bacterium TMED40]
TKVPKNVKFDGESLPDILLGKSNASRKQDMLFRRPPDRDSFYGVEDLPDLAIRSGKWKLLCEYDGSNALLYDLTTDRGEQNNIAPKHPKVVKELSKKVITWHKSMPADNGPQMVAGTRK